MSIYVIPPEFRKNIGGHAGFKDNGVGGWGLPSYQRMQGYGGFDVPTPIAARWFPPEPDYDDNDVAEPLAVGSAMTGGREIYREAVYQAVKKEGKQHGMKQSHIDSIKPRKVA